MVLIREIVQQALTTGYLTIAAQEQLRQLLQTTQYTQDDINAFMTLQQAAMDGHVKQEARKLIRLHRSGILTGKKQKLLSYSVICVSRKLNEQG
jgi:hypothetical protein